MDFAQARMHNYNLGRFTSPDDFTNDTHSSDPSSWNLYVYVRNNPLNLIDPTGMITDIIDFKTGTRTHIEDGKDQVLASAGALIDKLKTLVNENRSQYDTLLSGLESSDVTNLHLTTKEFSNRAATTYGESSAFRMKAGEELGNEMKAIASVNQRNDVAYGADNDQANDYMNTSPSNETDKMKLANLAIVNQATGGPDLSNGATGWDGREQALFADSDKRASVPDGSGGTWNLRKNTGGWNISDSDYAKWKRNVGSAFKAPQRSTASSGRNKGKVRYYSRAVHGNTIFWHITK